jgi:hypothetical protein
MSLNRNVGNIDKTIRLVAGLVLLLWAFMSAGLASAVGLIAAIVGAVLVLTGLINFCPLFKLLGISSHRSA